MAKRKLTSLRSVLLRYLLLCGGGCALILVLWWVIFMQLINIGFLLPAVASAQACAEARGTVASMTADTFDSLQISDLCRWAVVQNDTVLQTNMDDRHLKIAINAFHGGSGNLGYQYDVKMADGSFCLLQYDYATPYADPALRDTLPDFQTCYILLLAVLSIALGVIMIVDPFGTMETLVMAIGVILIVEGAINLLSALYTILAVRRFAKLHPETQSVLESITGEDLNGDGVVAPDVTRTDAEATAVELDHVDESATVEQEERE